MVAGWGVCGVPVGSPAILLHHSLFGGLDQVRIDTMIATAPFFLSLSLGFSKSTAFSSTRLNTAHLV